MNPVKFGYFWLGILVIILVYFVALHFNNGQNYIALPIPFSSPYVVTAGIVLVSSFVLGLFYAWVAMLGGSIAKNAQIRKLKKRIQELENQTKTTVETTPTVPYHSVE